MLEAISRERARRAARIINVGQRQHVSMTRRVQRTLLGLVAGPALIALGPVQQGCSSATYGVEQYHGGRIFQEEVEGGKGRSDWAFTFPRTDHDGSYLFVDKPRDFAVLFLGFPTGGCCICGQDDSVVMFADQPWEKPIHPEHSLLLVVTREDGVYRFHLPKGHASAIYENVDERWGTVRDGLFWCYDGPDRGRLHQFLTSWPPGPD